MPPTPYDRCPAAAFQASQRPPPRDFLLGAPLGPKPRRPARRPARRPRQAAGELRLRPLPAAIFRPPPPPRRGDDPGGGDCAGAHRSRPQRPRAGYAGPRAPALGVSRASPDGPPRPGFEPPVGSHKQASRLPGPDSRSPRFYLRGRIPRPSCCLARRSLALPGCTAPARRRAGPAEGSPAPGCCARLHTPPSTAPPPAGLRLRLLSLPRERHACAKLTPASVFGKEGVESPPASTNGNRRASP